MTTNATALPKDGLLSAARVVWQAHPDLSYIVAGTILGLAIAAIAALAVALTAKRRLREARAVYAWLQDCALAASDWCWEMDPGFALTRVVDWCGTPVPVARDDSDTSGHAADAVEDLQAPKWRTHFADLAVGRAFRDFPYVLRLANGETRTVSMSGAPLRDAHGRLCGYRGTMRDRTGECQDDAVRRHTELECPATSDHPLSPNASDPSAPEAHRCLHEAAIEHAPIGITIARAEDDQPFIYVNPAFERMTGYDGEEMLGRNCRFLQNPEPDPWKRAQIRHAMAAGTSTEVTLKNFRKDGTRFWNRFQLVPIRDTDGQIRYFLGTQRDITAEVEHAETAAREREFAELAHSRLQNAVESLGEAFVLYDADDRLVMWNTPFEKM